MIFFLRSTNKKSLLLNSKKNQLFSFCKVDWLEGSGGGNIAAVTL